MTSAIMFVRKRFQRMCSEIFLYYGSSMSVNRVPVEAFMYAIPVSLQICSHGPLGVPGSVEKLL